MSDTFYAILVIGMIALVTAMLRFLPFFIFNGRKPIPKIIQHLGLVLPYSVIAMLVVYCLKDVSFVNYSGWLPSMLSVLAVVILHVWKRNTLLSIVGGTVCYMLLIRF